MIFESSIHNQMGGGLGESFRVRVIYDNNNNNNEIGWGISEFQEERGARGSKRNSPDPTL